jgi:amidohydrolase
LKKIFTCMYQEEALVLRSMLESTGIPVELLSGDKLAVNPLFNIGVSGFTLQVPDNYELDALGVVEDFRQAGQAGHLDDAPPTSRQVASPPDHPGASAVPKAELAKMAAAALPQAITHRQALHAIPETGLELPRTLAYVEQALRQAGYSPKACGYGLIADTPGTGPLIAIRADMDALPMPEETGLPFASTLPGYMHACGHDAHTGSLLAVAAAVARQPPEGYRLRFIFQAGEEGFFGARYMIDAGCLDGVSAIVGAHAGDLSEELAPGQAGFMAGPMMAASDRFGGSFIGAGGHGSAPHQTRDPIPALAQYVLAAHTLRSRLPDQREPVVVSICQLEAGSAFNIIPGIANFKGTVRTFSSHNQQLMSENLELAGRSLAAAHHLEFNFEWAEGYPSLVNDQEATSLAVQTARQVLGPDQVVELKVPSMGGEDFAYYLQKVPGCFWFLNTQNPEKGIVHPNHHGRFDIDEAKMEKLMLGNLAIAAAFAERYR